MRELEQQCESREAVASKRTVTRLQAQSPGFREAFIINYCRCLVAWEQTHLAQAAQGGHV